MRTIVAALLAVLLAALPAAAQDGLTAAQKRRADQLISIFENGIPNIQYGYAEALGDGRGITAGRAGFTTGTGDAFLVVERYASLRPKALLATFLPELARLNEADDPGDTSGLDGFAEAWEIAARDPQFRAVQDQITDELYYAPAAAYADALALKTALARAAVYDAIIQHGDGEDPDSLWAMIERAEVDAGGTPESGVDEAEWLAAFLAVRRAVLSHATDPETRAAWAESVGRVDVFSALADAGNDDLDGPIHLSVGDYEVDIE